VGVALPDGTVAVFSSSPTMADAVGIVAEDDQALLSYPAVGCGEVSICGSDGRQDTYLACCLRGGTCYLLPMGGDGDNDKKRQEEDDDDEDDGPSIISAFHFPHDVPSELPDTCYVQGLTAGNLFLGSNRKPQPVLVYAWSGGIVDVCACGLIPARKSCEGEKEMPQNDSEDHEAPFVPRAERGALEVMSDNGSLSLLFQILAELRKDSKHPLLHEEEWRNVLQNPTPALAHNIGGLDLGTLCSADELRHLRTLMLSLADSSE
jgi:hypothetical protein